MKKYTITLWRGNPQLTDGGYETTRTVEAKSLASARKQADKLASRCAYGSMTVLAVREEV